MFKGLLQQDKDMLVAAVDLIGHTGADSVQVRYCDEEKPVVWMVVGQWGELYDVASSVWPVKAALRLLDQVIDGGTCTHCQRPTAVSEDFTEMPLNDMFCWYQYDPELKKFRRGCAGETA